jgi:mannose-1-phosphate guanylyltransferase
MIVVIIAGGSGTRLWPLSTPDYPKHLMKLNDGQRSLLQHTYERATKLASTVYVISDSGHAHHVQEQLPELDEETLLVEPARRGTASCVIAALAHLDSRHEPDEPIIFMHSDHYVRDVSGFIHSFMIAGHMSRQEGKIVLVGIEPDHPATGFGYIQKDELIDKELFVFSVHSFKEKPAFNLAQKYIRSGNYLWNGGYFVGSQVTFKKQMQKYSPGMYENYSKLLKTKTSDEFNKTYLGFESDAIDYALMEKVDDLLVVPAAFDWMDIGSYGDLHKAVESDEQGNHVSGEQVELEGVENSFIQNHDDRPLAVIGLDNVVVVNTKDGILVARKDLAQKVGEVSKRFGK